MSKRFKAMLMLLGVAAWLVLSFVFMLPPVVWEFQLGHARLPCAENRRQVESAIEQWAMERNKTKGDPIIEAEVVQYLKGNRMPTCPDGGTYICRVVGEKPICSLQNTPPRKIRISPFMYRVEPEGQHYRHKWE